MKLLRNVLRGATGAMVAMSILSGCAVNMKIPVKDPALTSESFDKARSVPETSLVFKDDEAASDKTKLVSGRIPMQLVYQEKPFDPVPWIGVQTVKEMAARGLPVKLAATGENGTAILIKRVHIENHRVSGFSPFVTFTSLRADVETADGPRRVTAYIKRGKVPMWSFDEVIDPTYNDPLSILTKELGAKLNQELFHQVVSTEKVNALIAKVTQNSTRSDAYLDVYQLGFSNNPAAIPALVKLSTNEDEYVRLAALSSLGILKATGQMSFLVSRYESKDGMWQDHAMALKAIGDFGTPESRAYLQAQWKSLENKTDTEALWTKEILALYL